MIDVHEFLDGKEAAKFFGVTVATFRTWHRQGKLPAPLIMPSGKMRWTLSMLKSAIKTPDSSAAA